MSLLRLVFASLLLGVSLTSALAEELPWGLVWVDPDGTVQRQRFADEDGLGWVVHKDGMRVLDRSAEKEQAFRASTLFGSGAYTVYLQLRVGDRPRVVSNVVTFHLAPGKNSLGPIPAQPKAGEQPPHRIWADTRGVVNRPATGASELRWVMVDAQGKQKVRNADHETQLVAWPQGAALRVTLEEKDKAGAWLCVSNEIEIQAPTLPMANPR